MARYNYDRLFFTYFQNMERRMNARALNLGGGNTGSGGPPGGFVGYLPQNRVSFDSDEAEVWDIPPSGISLITNLNRIRYRLSQLEEGGGGGGDMYKSTYDTDDSGTVDYAEGVDWSNIDNVPSTFTPSSHTHTESDITDLTHTDDSAIHDNVSSEIHSITEKTTPSSNDEIIIEDSGASYAKKRVKLSNLPGGSDPDAIHLSVSQEINSLDEKYAPAGEDIVVIEDSEDTYSKKYVQISNLGGGTPDAVDVTYTPDNSSNWIYGTPTTVQEALDQLAERVKDIEDSL